MNKTLYTKKIDTLTQVLSVEYVDEEKVVVKLATDESFEIRGYHGQDCCESVYADFSVMKYYKDTLLASTVSQLVIKGVEKMGFLLCFDTGYGSPDVKIFIPCYNYQNGYYSSDLQLIVEYKKGEYGSTETIDISELVEDNID